MVKIYGRWCGPNWTNNRAIAARDYLLSGGSFKTKCKDKLDCACRAHDKGCAQSELGCSASVDQELINVANAIASNPLYFFTNPKMYAASFLVRDGIRIAQLTRRH